MISKSVVKNRSYVIGILALGLLLSLGGVALAGKGGDGKGGGKKDPPPPIESPDLTIAYTDNTRQESRLIVSKPDGSARNVVFALNDGWALRSPTWSPEGDALAFLMRLDGTPGPSIALLPMDPSKGQAVDVNGDGAIDSSDLRIVANIPSDCWGGSHLSWSPRIYPSGGTLIAYDLSHPDDCVETGSRHIYIVDPDWHNSGPPIVESPVRLTPDEPFWNEAVSWSPLASSIAVVTNDDGFGVYDIKILELDYGVDPPSVMVYQSLVEWCGSESILSNGGYTSGVSWSGSWSGETANLIAVAQDDKIVLVPLDDPCMAEPLVYTPEAWIDWSPDDTMIAGGQAVPTGRQHPKADVRINVVDAITGDELHVIDVQEQFLKRPQWRPCEVNPSVGSEVPACATPIGF